MTATETDAELARSILACPADAALVVDGFPAVGRRRRPRAARRGRHADVLLPRRARSWPAPAQAGSAGPGDPHQRARRRGRPGARRHAHAHRPAPAPGSSRTARCCGERRHDVAPRPRLRACSPAASGGAGAGSRCARSARPVAAGSTAATSSARSSTPTTATATTSATWSLAAHRTPRPSQLLDASADRPHHRRRRAGLDRPSTARTARAVPFSRPARTVEELGDARCGTSCTPASADARTVGYR